jgi:uncharacterized membrane protein
MRALFLIFLIIASGCLVSSGKSGIKLESEIVPNKISLEEAQSLTLEARVTNIGKAKETITAEAIPTEGLSVSRPERTDFTLKPGESRTITFNATLLKDAVPGDYIIDIQVKTGTGEVITGVAKLRVVQKKGII